MASPAEPRAPTPSESTNAWPASTAPLSFEIVRYFDAAPERVFDAWLSEHWAEWLAPGDFTGTTLLFEPRVGGRYRLEMRRPDGSTTYVSGRYLEISRPRRLVLTWVGAHSPEETVLTLAFEADGEGTRLTLQHVGFGSAELRDRHHFGWSGPTGALRQLEQHLVEETSRQSNLPQ